MSSTNFHDWLAEIIADDTPDDSIVAYYFGIFEGEGHYTVYLTGSSVYDPTDADWACNRDFEPTNKYCVLPSYMDSISWNKVLEEVEKYLKDFVNSSVFSGSFFAKAKAIATGFDDGDLVVIDRW